jgi:quercetin dioxygenase-like cupin family protein
VRRDVGFEFMLNALRLNDGVPVMRLDVGAAPKDTCGCVLAFPILGNSETAEGGIVMVELYWRESRATSLVLCGLFLTAAVGCGTALTPTPAVTLAPTLAAPAVAAPTEQGVTRALLGRGSGNFKEAIIIKAGKTNVVTVKATLVPGGFLDWHYHDQPTLWTVLSGTFTISHADGTTEKFPAGSAFSEKPGKSAVHRMDNKGTVDAVYLVTVLLPPEVPAMVYVPGPGGR